MKQLQLIMGVPITVEILDASATEADIERAFVYFRSIDETFSTYKEESEISKIKRGELAEEEYSDAVKTILAGGDIQVAGTNNGHPWRIGIRNPFNRNENVKVLSITDKGVATSGTAIRGQHVYNPYQPEQPIQDIVSLTVIGPNVYEADRFATAAFAMGKRGIYFIERLEGFEGYTIDSSARATYTSGFERFVLSYDEIH